MSKRLLPTLILTVVVAASLLAALPAAAQRSAASIGYGETVEGELTSSARRVSYAFTGKAGEVAVVQLVPTVDGGLFGAEVSITDDRDDELADSTRLIIFGRQGQIIAAELPEDGEYAVNVFTRANSTDTGKYELRLLQAIPLELDTPLEESTTSTPDGKRTMYRNFYLLDGRRDVTLAYEKGRSKYAPFVVVYGVFEGNNLFPIGYLGGEGILGGALNIGRTRNFIVIGVGPFGIGALGQGSEETADYTLTLSALKR